jgi:ribosomal protein S1
METITKINETKKTKTIEATTTAAEIGIDPIKVPDWSYFEDDTITDYGENDIFKLTVENIQVPKPGHVYDTIFIGSDETHFLLDADFKDLVRVPKTSEESNFFISTEIGDTIRAVVMKITDEREYSIDGSVSRIHREEAFEMLSDMRDDYYLNVKIDKLTGAGYNCTVMVNDCEIKSFLPQILAGVNKIHDDDKEELVGQELEMCIESYAEDKGTWIVSRRKYLKQLIPAYMDNLDTETDYTGKVTGTAKFGVFVEFNDCLTGMIHRSNLTNELKESFDDIKQGDDITFNVKEIIKGNRIILTQVHTTSLWDTISINQVLTGTVKEHKPFGSLIILDHETLGLIHSSEQTPDVKDLKSGDKLEVKVLAINRSERKIYLRNT